MKSCRRKCVIIAAETLESRRLLSKTIYVDANPSITTHDGASWSSAYADLQQALSAAVSGDQIDVAHGTYKPTSSTDRTISFQLKDGVAIYGSYAGFGATNPNARDLVNDQTTLSGDIGVAGNATDNSYHVIYSYNVSSSAVVDGFTITGGYATGTGTYQKDGAGLIDIGANPTINNCTFTGNTAGVLGTGSGAGGAIYDVDYSDAALTNCTFSNNACDYGAAMYNTTSSPVVTNCTFSKNTATYYGGAVWNDGGIYQITAPTFSNCTFTANTATNNGGGAMSNNIATPTLISCVFNGNRSVHGTGGAIDNVGSSPAIINCTFVGNAAAGSGGAIINQQSSPVLTNCTLSANIAAVQGAAIYDFSSSAPKLVNCILWGNSSPTGLQIDDTAVTATYSDIQGGFTGTGNINSVPLLVRTPSAGADNTWGTSDDDYGNLRLSTGSPAIDAGSNAAVPSGITTDFDGNPRIVDIPGVHDPGAIVDMGAYEAVAPLALTTGAYLSTNSAPSISFTFNNVLATSSISTTDVTINAVLSNGSLGTSIAATGWSYSVSTKTLTFILPTSTADANYHAVMPMNSVSGVAGESLSADSPLDFFILTADANHDRTVNALDFNALATNYGKPGTFNQGDFDYSGTVDSNDFAILASRYGTVLAAPSGSAMPASSAGLAARATSLFTQPAGNLFADQPISAVSNLLE